MVSQNGEARQERPGSGNGFNPIGPVHRKLADLAGQVNKVQSEINATYDSLVHPVFTEGGDGCPVELTIGADGCLYGLVDDGSPVSHAELLKLRTWLNRVLDDTQAERTVLDKIRYGRDAGKSPEPVSHRSLVPCGCLNCQTERMLAGVKSQLEKDNPGATVEVVELRFDGVPLVKTGPGGDFTIEVCPSDLEVGRAAGVALRAVDRLADMVDRVKKHVRGRTPAASSAAKGTDAPGSPS